MRSSLLFLPFLLIHAVFSADKDYTQLKGLPIEKSNARTLGAIYDLKKADVEMDLFIGSPHECHEVVFCSIKAIPVDATQMIDRNCENHMYMIVFRPIENTMYVGSVQYFYQRPVARFVPDGQGNHVIKTQLDFDGYFSQVAEQDTKVKLGNYLIVLSSGPSCPTRLRVAGEGFTGQRVIMSHITGEKPRATNGGHTKRVSNLPDTIFETAKMKTGTDCCFSGAYDFDSIIGDDYTWQNSQQVSKTTWQKYTIKAADKPKNGLKSLVLFVQDGCRWLRVCFNEIKDNGDLCDDISLDMYFEGGAYVPIDDLQATPFIAQEGTTDMNKFVLEMTSDRTSSRVTLKYGAVNEPEDYYAVEHQMLSRYYTDKDQYVTLVAAPQCRAGLTRHTGNVGLGGNAASRSVAGRQMLHIAKCECYTKE